MDKDNTELTEKERSIWSVVGSTIGFGVFLVMLYYGFWDPIESVYLLMLVIWSIGAVISIVMFTMYYVSKEARTVLLESFTKPKKNFLIRNVMVFFVTILLLYTQNYLALSIYMVTITISFWSMQEAARYHDYILKKSQGKQDEN